MKRFAIVLAWALALLLGLEVAPIYERLFAAFPPYIAGDYPAQILGETPAPTAYWHLGEASGDVADSSTNAYASTAANLTYGSAGAIASYSNNAITSNGTSSSVSLTSTSALNNDRTDPLTVEAWVYPNITRSGGSKDYCIAAKMQSSVPFTGWSVCLTWTTTKTILQIFKISVFNINHLYATGTTDIANGAWSHIAITLDATGRTSGLRFYINGIPDGVNIGADTLTVGSTTNSVSATIFNRNGINFFNGRIDELAIWNGTALTKAQVNNHYLYGIADVSVTQVNAVPVIYTADWGGDSDDIIDTHLLAWLSKAGYLSLIGVTGESNVDAAAQGLETHLQLMGISGVPIGQYQGSTASPDYFATTFRNHYVPLAQRRARSTYPSGVTVMRQALFAAANNSVVVVANGLGVNLAALLASASGDDGINVTGLTLVSTKVKALYWAAGIYPSGSEYDFTAAPAEGNAVVTTWPTTVPIIFVGIELAGDTAPYSIVTGTAIDTNFAAEYPTRYAFDTWATAVGATPSDGRPAWGQLTIIAAVMGMRDWFGYIGKDGTNTVNAGTGANSWAATPHVGHSYLQVTPAAYSTFVTWINARLYTSLRPALLKVR